MANKIDSTAIQTHIYMDRQTLYASFSPKAILYQKKIEPENGNQVKMQMMQLTDSKVQKERKKKNEGKHLTKNAK